MDGDLLDAIETVSEHLIATHVHDNRGRTDDHLVPFDGTIDWPAALTAVQKVGYDGTLLFEIAAHGSPKDTLAQGATKARETDGTLLALTRRMTTLCTSTSKTSASTRAKRSPSRAGCTIADRAARSIS